MNNIIILILKKTRHDHVYQYLFCIAGRIVIAIGGSRQSGSTAPLPKDCFCYYPAGHAGCHVIIILFIYLFIFFLPVRDFSWEIFKIPLKYRKLHFKMEHWILFISFLLNSVDAWYCQILI